MQAWVLNYGSCIGTGLRFTPSDCHATFPFSPDKSHHADEILKDLATGGNLLHIIRQTIMKDRNYDLSALYNDFHDRSCDSGEILRMRKIQRLMDYVVLEQNQRNDINLEQGFHVLHDFLANDNIRYTISVSAQIENSHRLAQLNRQRWQEEQEDS